MPAPLPICTSAARPQGRVQRIDGRELRLGGEVDEDVPAGHEVHRVADGERRPTRQRLDGELDDAADSLWCW